MILQACWRCLKKNSFLFDEGEQDNDTLAISFNNRCYARMQLGKLQEALEDCNASLKYGSLPDAYHKQQALVKKLSVTQ